MRSLKFRLGLLIGYMIALLIIVGTMAYRIYNHPADARRRQTIVVVSDVGNEVELVIHHLMAKSQRATKLVGKLVADLQGLRGGDHLAWW